MMDLHRQKVRRSDRPGNQRHIDRERRHRQAFAASRIMSLKSPLPRRGRAISMVGQLQHPHTGSLRSLLTRYIRGPQRSSLGAASGGSTRPWRDCRQLVAAHGRQTQSDSLRWHCFRSPSATSKPVSLAVASGCSRIGSTPDRA